MEYLLYARKSSDREDKQVQSIPDQVNRLLELAQKENIKISKLFKESKSAKKPYIRKEFEDMIELIDNNPGKYGILCWGLNRLSRNPIDSGKISWFLQQGIIVQIHTIDRLYKSDDNVLLYNVITGMANQYILDLTKDVRRGTESKLKKGWAPYRPPIGYMNDVYNHTIIVDEERFDKVRKVFDLYLSRRYSVDELMEIIENDIKLTTRRKNVPAKKTISRAGLYRVLSNPFYLGIIPYKDKLYPGKHKPMIAKEEHREVLRILKTPNKVNPYKASFKYSGIFKCPNCKHMMTGEEKIRRLIVSGELKSYIYYHCTYKSKTKNCRGIPFVKEEEADKLISNLLKEYEIPLSVQESISKEINRYNMNNTNNNYEMYLSKINEHDSIIDNLIDLKCRSLISEEEFKSKKELYENKRKEIEEQQKEKKDLLSVINNYLRLSRDTVN